MFGRGGPSKNSTSSSAGSTRGPGGRSSTSPPKVLQNPSQAFPGPLSFLFRVEPLRPNFKIQGKRLGTHGGWDPPTKHTAYKRENGPLYRWLLGHVRETEANSHFLKAENLVRYGAATVFTQSPANPLLAVNFDVGKRDVSTTDGWKTLSFDHTRIGTSRNFCSYVDPAGGDALLAAPDASRWVRQLLPDCYAYQPGNDDAGYPAPPNRGHAGLTGKLPLLISIAAFSAPPAQLQQVLLGCIRPHQWICHQYASGRDGPSHEHRGMVVTVYLDRGNPTWSTAALLNQLENGEFGVFYGP